MTLTWTGWEQDPNAKVSPYVDWLHEITFDRKDEVDGLTLLHQPTAKRAAKITGITEQRAPLMKKACADETRQEDPLIKLTWMPDDDCAVVGVIDSGIALAHERFRRIDGGTRFLSAWLQGGDWREDGAVPFGRELFRTEIDQLMFRAQVAGTIDESEFDRMAGSSQFPEALGDRRPESSATHGTFVADLAAGYDLRDSSQDEHRRRLPIIAVGLPPNTSMGSSGNFLEFFAMHAIEYIIDRADRIWDACGLPKGGAFPIVINLSYGLQAGPKDGHMLIEQVIRAVNAESEKSGRPIRVILPAGNDLLSEGAAAFDLATGACDELDWRISPEDHTLNFAELWSDRMDGDYKGGEHTLGLAVSPPGGPASTASPGCAGQINTLKDGDRVLARIYCRAHDSSGGGHRLSYVVCTVPTLTSDRMHGAPAGAWTWRVMAQDAAKGFAYVQSDQNLTYGGNTGLVATFAHPDFDAYDDTGQYIDVASYTTPPVNTDVTPPMRRRDTLNTIASLEEARTIGSYRTTDGAPSLFSSAATTAPIGDGRDQPTCLLPGDDGISHFGLMAAGSRSGSAALLAGTSFSTALATRAVSQAMLDWIAKGRKGTAPGTEEWFKAEAAVGEAAKSWPHPTVPKKAGYGRMLAPETGRLPRSEVPT
ncbi:MAG: S8 family serine peptidase [Pseudomonadota bacterium]